MNPELAKQEIAYWKKWFRILKGWKIKFDPEYEFKDQCTYDGKQKRAFIFDSSYEKVPDDYIFHEMLHLCMADIRSERSSKKKRDKEEIFVQDLCRMLFGGDDEPEARRILQMLWEVRLGHLRAPSDSPNDSQEQARAKDVHAGGDDPA